MLIFCNKQDVAGALSPKEILEVLDLKNIKGRHWGIQPCSAVKGDGLLEGMDFIVDDIRSRIYLFN